MRTGFQPASLVKDANRVYVVWGKLPLPDDHLMFFAKYAAYPVRKDPGKQPLLLSRHLFRKAIRNRSDSGI